MVIQGFILHAWPKRHGSFFKAMETILEKMKNKKNRSAVFICSLSYISEKKKSYSVVGKIKGTISKKIIGKRGFGYDPIFIPDKYLVTFGQMPKLKKILIDHRYIAFQKLKKKIKIL